MRDDNCIFCKIANGEIPSETIYEDETFRVILPKQHYSDICELDEDVAAKVLPLAAKIGTAMKKTLNCAGFNVVQNNGVEAGQTVFHFHVHIIPRYEKGPVMVSWVPGEVSPEELTETGAAIRSTL